MSKIDKEWDAYKDKLQEHKIFLANKEIKKLKGDKKILRVLAVNKFGLVNCDRLINNPLGAKIVVSYTDVNGKRLNLKNVVLIEKGRNAIFRFKKEIQFNPEKENLLWGLTANGRLAYFSTNDFKGLRATSGKVILKMNVHPTELNTYDEIINVLFPN